MSDPLESQIEPRPPAVTARPADGFLQRATQIRVIQPVPSHGKANGNGNGSWAARSAVARRPPNGATVVPIQRVPRHDQVLALIDDEFREPGPVLADVLALYSKHVGKNCMSIGPMAEDDGQQQHAPGLDA